MISVLQVPSWSVRFVGVTMTPIACLSTQTTFVLDAMANSEQTNNARCEKGIPHSRSSGRATQGGGHNTATVGGAVQDDIKGGTLGGG